MLIDSDLKQIGNLIKSFYNKKKFFPFAEDLIKEYSLFFPKKLSEKDKDKIDNYVNIIILNNIEKKGTKGSVIMLKILNNNDELWKKFRKMNSPRFFNLDKYKEVGKKIELLINQGEDKLTEKLVGHKSIGIQKSSDAWYNMVYAIFPEWNKI